VGICLGIPAQVRLRKYLKIIIKTSIKKNPMEQTINHKSPAYFIIPLTLILSLGYSLLRYNILGPVPWKDFPFLIVNKGISLSSFILLSLNFSFGPLKNLGIKISKTLLNSRVALGISGFFLMIIHALMSLLLFKPTVYVKFFEADGTMTLTAGLSMLGGILAFVLVWAYNMGLHTHLSENKILKQFIVSRSFLLIAMLLGGAHLFFMGYNGWINPSGWHGGLPPVSLIAFLFFFVGYIINLLGRRSN